MSLPPEPDVTLHDPEASDSPLLEQAPRPTPEPPTCANCGAAVSTRYCGQCGQEQTEALLSVRHIVGDFLGHFLALDTRFWRTIRLLMAKPGQLTKLYVQGQRVRYTRPSRLYLIISLIFFFSLSVIGTEGYRLTFNGSSGTDRTEEATEEATAPALTSSVTNPTASTAQEANQTAGTERSEEATAPAPTSPNTDLTPRATESAPAGTEAAADRATPEESPSDIMVDELANGFLDGLTDDGEDNDDFSGFIAERIFGRRDEVTALFVRHLPKLMFLMVPIFAFLVSLIYRSKKQFYVAHLIFALHLHAFTFLIRVPALYLDEFLETDLASGITELATIVYLYLALRRVYGQGRGKTLLKTMLLLNAYWFALALGFLALLMLAVFSI